MSQDWAEVKAAEIVDVENSSDMVAARIFRSRIAVALREAQGEWRPKYVEQWNWESNLQRLRDHWSIGEIHPNVFDMAAAWCGWHPLCVGEIMTIHIDGKEYEVKRNE